jgi:UDP-N-acetylmuramyl pentapeptide phosphotransferase/UDP-N-acetylglucosamine-1-phosphate transferase
LAGIIANNMFHFAPALRAVRMPEVFALFAGVSVGAVLGYLDDRLELRARWQFISQFVLAGSRSLAASASRSSQTRSAKTST